ncbi:MAG: 4'-phosphopantetheinyl transferase superfamily protein [Streptosporangiaceae bacterium]
MQSVTERPAVAALRGPVAIGRDALHVWLIDLDAPGPAAAAALDATERDRAASLVRPQDGARFTARRAALRWVLARYLGGEPGDLEFRVGPHGQPRLAGDEVRFSLTSSGGLALIAVSRSPVGVDLERIEPRPGIADLAAVRFAAREAASIAAGCCGPPTLSFYRHWTAKEAYLKAVGLGLAGLRDAELVCGARPAIWFAGSTAGGWSLSPASVPGGYVATIAGRTLVTSWRSLSSGSPVTPAGPAGSCR